MKPERKLTAAEERRSKQFKEAQARYEARGWRMTPLTMGVLYANIMALVVMLPMCAVVVAAYLWRGGSLFNSGSNPLPGLALFIVGMLALTVLHEAVHGLTWSLFVPGRLKSVEFGFIKETLTPYCTCREPLTRRQYVCGSLMPLLVTGIVPSALAVVTGSLWLLYLGVVMVLGAGGDVLVTLKLLGYGGKGEMVCLDHPTEVGLAVFEKP